MDLVVWITTTRKVRAGVKNDTYEQDCFAKEPKGGDDEGLEVTAELASRESNGRRSVELRSAGARSEVEACEWLLEVLKKLIKKKGAART